MFKLTEDSFDNEKITKTINAAHTITTVVAVICIVCKLFGVIDAPWIYVLAPLWAPYAVSMALLVLFVLCIAIRYEWEKGHD